VPATTAADLLARRFAGTPLRLTASAHEALLVSLSTADVFAGASYDGLVALEAATHGRTLFTLDRRAQDTYRRLGAAFQVIAG
jgi:hypothetical protein